MKHIHILYKDPLGNPHTLGFLLGASGVEIEREAVRNQSFGIGGQVQTFFKYFKTNVEIELLYKEDIAPHVENFMLTAQLGRPFSIAMDTTKVGKHEIQGASGRTITLLNPISYLNSGDPIVIQDRNGIYTQKAIVASNDGLSLEINADVQYLFEQGSTLHHSGYLDKVILTKNKFTPSRDGSLFTLDIEGVVL